MSFRFAPIARLSLALCCGLFGALAQAAAPTFSDLQNMPAPMRAQTLKAIVAQQAAERAANGSGPLDVTAPVLVAFAAGTKLDATRSAGQVLFNLTLTDELSGLSDVALSVTSPSGSQFTFGKSNLWGLRRFVSPLAMASSPFLEGGTWVVESVFARDVAGNYFFCETACLALLGNAQFAVNSPNGDTQPPKLVSGAIGTPRISLSRPPQGTAGGVAPFARISLVVADAGAAGVSYTRASFCKLDSPWECFDLSGEGSEVYGSRPAIAHAGNFVFEGPQTSVGVYELASLYLKDRAGNYTSFSSDKFGGSTDFSLYFPTTQITLLP